MRYLLSIYSYISRQVGETARFLLLLALFFLVVIRAQTYCSKQLTLETPSETLKRSSPYRRIRRIDENTFGICLRGAAGNVVRMSCCYKTPWSMNIRLICSCTTVKAAVKDKLFNTFWTIRFDKWTAPGYKEDLSRIVRACVVERPVWWSQNVSFFCIYPA